jgi:5-methylthioadenosine/S-adenosylhomocysteine deaminase
LSLLVKGVLHKAHPTDLYVEDGVIASMGERVEADEVIDGTGKALLPGLVNAHTHSAMTLFRGYADDMALQEWLTGRIWPLEAHLTPDDIYHGTRLACLEMVKSGTTCFNDMYFHMDRAAEAAAETGLRAILSEGFIDFGDPDSGKEMLAETRGINERIREVGGSRVQAALGPHGIYTVSEESLLAMAEWAEKEDLRIHIHLSETEQEVNDCKEAHGKRPVEYLEGLGFLGPRVVAAHGVWLSKEEIAILARRNVKVVHNPGSNMKLAVGRTMPLPEMMKAGVTVALGTDGAASNNSLDMFGAMKLTALLHKATVNDPTVLPAEAVLALATQGGADALGLPAGAIREGALADLILLDLHRPELVPGHNLTSDAVYSASGACVDTVICDGRVLMKGGRVKGEGAILEGAREAARSLLSRAQEA